MRGMQNSSLIVILQLLPPRLLPLRAVNLAEHGAVVADSLELADPFGSFKIFPSNHDDFVALLARVLLPIIDRMGYDHARPLLPALHKSPNVLRLRRRAALPIVAAQQQDPALPLRHIRSSGLHRPDVQRRAVGRQPHDLLRRSLDLFFGGFAARYLRRARALQKYSPLMNQPAHHVVRQLRRAPPINIFCGSTAAPRLQVPHILRAYFFRIRVVTPRTAFRRSNHGLRFKFRYFIPAADPRGLLFTGTTTTSSVFP